MLDFVTSVTSRLKQGPLAAPWAPQSGYPPTPLSSHMGTGWASGERTERGRARLSCQPRALGGRIWGWECDSRVAPVG